MSRGRHGAKRPTGMFTTPEQHAGGRPMRDLNPPPPAPDAMRTAARGGKPPVAPDVLPTAGRGGKTPIAQQAQAARLPQSKPLNRMTPTTLPSRLRPR